MSRLVAILLLPYVSLVSGRSAEGQETWLWDGEPRADNRPFTSPITGPVKANLQEIVDAGTNLDRVVGRVGQIGDSITFSTAFFRNSLLVSPNGNETGHDYDPIRSWLAYSGQQPADANSFYRDYGKGILYGSFSGWTILDAINEGHPAMAIEVGDGVTSREFSWALIMFGTNDIDEPTWDPVIWKEGLSSFVQDHMTLGVIPVLSGIPPEAVHLGDGRVEVANEIIRELAASASVPYVDPATGTGP